MAEVTKATKRVAGDEYYFAYDALDRLELFILTFRGFCEHSECLMDEEAGKEFNKYAGLLLTELYEFCGDYAKHVRIMKGEEKPS